MFNQYIIEKNELNILTEMPYFCEKYYKDEEKKCKKFYKRIASDSCEEGLYQCPYGFSSYKYNRKIYSCLIVYGNSDVRKVNIHLATYKQNIKDFTNYSANQLRAIVEYEGDLEQKQRILRLVKDGILSITDAAKRANMSVADFEKAYKTFLL